MTEPTDPVAALRAHHRRLLDHRDELAIEARALAHRATETMREIDDLTRAARTTGAALKAIEDAVKTQQQSKPTPPRPKPSARMPSTRRPTVAADQPPPEPEPDPPTEPDTDTEETPNET